ncbi:MAG: SIMPL domain-containing protein [Alphaproteobacteria bacterium]|nr:SIMPL domain-containing protein [Alphaproteobacteria bacterium]
MRMKTAIFASLLILSLPAHAQDENSLRLPPPGHTILNLSATETQKVGQDLLVSSLRIEAEDEDPVAVQTKINAAMADAIKMAKEHTDIKTTTGSYSVYPYDPTPPTPYPDQQTERKPQRWRGMQAIEMQSLKSDELLKFTGELQGKGFIMSSLGYTISPEKFESVQDDLLVKALAKLEAKAKLAARSLNKSGYDMVDVNINQGGGIPYYARAEMAMADMGAMKSMPAPVAQAGESDVSLNVSARVMLKP